MTTAVATTAPAKPTARVRVLADAVGTSIAANIAVVLVGTALLAGAARVIIPLPFTPVPVSLATLAVFGIGAAMGPLRGFASAALYMVLGLAGVPVFAGGNVGWAFASFGYVIGYVAAATLAGYLASRAWDRKPLTTGAIAVLGTVVVYAFGLVWLGVYGQMGVVETLQAGAVPFIIGDLLKAAVLAGVMPAAWALLGRRA